MGNCGCTCVGNYTGNNCESICANGVDGNPCQNNGQAIGNSGVCDCICVKDFTGANCEIPGICTNGTEFWEFNSNDVCVKVCSVPNCKTCKDNSKTSC